MSVKVVPGASRDRIAGVLGECLKLTTSAAAEKGKANTAITKMLAATLRISPRDITLRTGRTSARKEFCISGMSAEAVRSRLEKL